MSVTKPCSRCGKEKILQDFYPSPRNFLGREAECKKCALARRKERRLSDHGKSLNRERKNALKRKFGISPEDYDAMYDAQEGVCAICHREEASPNRRLAVDHCHTTGKIRGLLCWPCNAALGKFQDDPERLRSAAVYIERSRHEP